MTNLSSLLNDVYSRVLRLLQNPIALAITWLSLEVSLYYFPAESALAYSLLIFCVSTALLILSADLFTDSAIEIGQTLGFTELAVGVLLIAIGTSAPEMFASIGAIINEQPSLVIGNLLGTVIANSCLAIGLAALLSKNPLPVHKEVVGTKMILYVGSSLLLLTFFFDRSLSNYESILLLGIFIFYLYSFRSNIMDASLVRTENPNQNTTQNKKQKQITLILRNVVIDWNNYKAFWLGIFALALLYRSGDFVIGSMIASAVFLGLQELKVATTVLAVGTSIPEIVTAVVLAYKGKSDALFGEIIGSNLIALLGIFGLCGLISTISLSGDVLWFLLISTVVTAVFSFIVVADHRVTRLEGLILLLLFQGFVGILLEI